MICTYILHDEILSFSCNPEYFKNELLNPTGIKMYYCSPPKFPDYHIEEDPTVKAGTRLKISVSQANRSSDPTHIDFICATEQNPVRAGYSALLDTELILRKLFRICALTVENKQKYLRLIIRNGQEVTSMRLAVDRWCRIGENHKQMDVSEAVLCTLHCELRTNENKISTLFNDGFIHRKQPALVKEYREAVEKVVNRGKVGLSSHQNQWRFPMNKANDGVSPDFSLKNEMGRCILEKSDDLIEICLKFHTETYKTEWRNVLQEFHELILFLNKREHFTDKMILEFQKLADRYSTSWANLAGPDGQTNYKHFF